MRKLFFVFLLTSICVETLPAQDFSRYEKKEFISGRDTLRYRILYPEKYNPKRTYPLLVFLHGSEERGRDNEAQLLHGGDIFLQETFRKKHPSIIVFPQCPNDSTWSEFKRNENQAGKTMTSNKEAPLPQRMVKELMDRLIQKRIADGSRIYIGGFSLGGYGTYDLLIRYPDYFAAAFPICGGSDIPLVVAKAKKIPMWIFHGALDDVVPPASDRELFAALKRAGNKDITYTEYAKGTHNSWDSAFAEPGLLPWIFSHKK